MATEVPDQFASEARRSMIRMPRPWCIGLAAIVLIVVTMGLRIGLPVYRQQVVIRAIVKQGGFVDSDDPIPTAFIRIWPESYAIEAEHVIFRDVHEVDLAGAREADDAVLASLRELPHLRYLDLTFTRVTDAGIAHLTAHEHLESLLLSATGVMDAAIVHLKSMKSLRHLHMVATGISYQGVNALTAALPTLRVER